MVSKQALQKFKEIYLKEFGEELTDAEAFELGNNLLNLYRAVYLPNLNINISQNHEEKLQHPQN